MTQETIAESLEILGEQMKGYSASWNLEALGGWSIEPRSTANEVRLFYSSNTG